MTCYENVNKVMGLKAANAFWNPHYYDPTRRTLTKRLIYTGEKELQSEIRALVWMAIVTNRTLILPNVLANERIGTVDLYYGQALWPGFRLAYLRPGIDVDIVEPAFYWRIRRDYLRTKTHVDDTTSGASIPEPFIVEVDRGLAFDKVASFLKSYSEHTRLVIHMSPPAGIMRWSSAHQKAQKTEQLHNITKLWADDSVGIWRSFSEESRDYGKLVAPYGKGFLKYRAGEYSGKYFVNNVRLCRKVFAPMRGNRSCFDKCD